MAQFIGIASLNFILFSGGLDTNWTNVKPVFWKGFSLSTLGVLLTALSLGLFVWAVTDFTIWEGLLLGSIVSSTDAAAVFSVLRSKSIALKGKLRATLEFESGSNDPMAFVLTLTFLSIVISQDASASKMIYLFLMQMIIGGGLGYLFGRLSKLVINNIKLDYEGLYPVLVVALMFITFSATDFLNGNGFLAVYLCALYLGNHDLIHKKTILKVFDGFAWLMQIVLFLTLGLLVFPSQIFNILGIGFLISFFLILVARPLSVLISLLPFKMIFSRKLFISWVGLRGAVPIVFATYALIAGIDKADMIFNIVFFVSITSLILQGTTIGIVSKWLGVALPVNVKPKTPVEIFLSEDAKTVMTEIKIPENSIPVGKKIVDLNFPREAIISLIHRDEEYFTPSGFTVILPKDILLVLADNHKAMDSVYECLGLEKH